MNDGKTEGESRESTFARLREVAILFLTLGATAWGGPAVSEAMMHDEAVHRRKWVDDQKFLDILGATNLIPGPNAVEVAIHLGLIRAGWPGFFSAGLLFLIPGTLMALFFAWIYVAFGSLPAVGWVLYGIKPVVIAVIIQALFRLGKRSFQRILLVIIGVASLILYILGIEEMILLFGGAAVVLMVRGGRKLLERGVVGILVLPSLVGLIATVVNPVLNTITQFNSTTLFFRSLKIGALLFGAGYVLIALARSEFVVDLGWITNEQLIDAIAVGQALPGPLSKSMTFIGYILGGLPSAAIATVAFFLPSFLLVALLSRIVTLIRKTWWAAAFIDGVTVASLGLMAGAAIDIGRSALVDVFSTILALASVFLIFKFKIKTHWIILGGGALGMAYKLFFG